MQISRGSVRIIVKDQLGLQPRKLFKAHDLTEAMSETARKSEENATAHNHQNDLQLLSKGTSPDVVTRSHFPKSIMVWAGITATGKTPLVFVHRNVKINAAIYQQLVLKDILDPWAKKHFGDRPWTLQQDWGASSFGKDINFLLQKPLPRLVGSRCLAPKLARYESVRLFRLVNPAEQSLRYKAC
uniref:Uncharacterized protein n=1 Tax=Plectus sambesii TaxID=2011161 RepID=A0A914XPU0_9BILA